MPGHSNFTLAGVHGGCNVADDMPVKSSGTMPVRNAVLEISKISTNSGTQTCIGSEATVAEYAEATRLVNQLSAAGAATMMRMIAVNGWTGLTEPKSDSGPMKLNPKSQV